MEVKDKTGITHIQYRALIRRHIDGSDGLAAELGITEDDLWIEFADYITISTRVIPDEPEYAGHFANATEDTETVHSKFRAFLNIPPDKIQSWRNAIIAKDSPDDEALAPAMVIETEKNAKGDVTSKRK